MHTSLMSEAFLSPRKISSNKIQGIITQLLYINLHLQFPVFIIYQKYQFLNKNNSGTTRCVMKMNENSMHAVIHFSHTVPIF